MKMRFILPLVGLLGCVYLADAQSLAAKAGTIDTRFWNYRENKLWLNGEWIFFNRSLQAAQKTAELVKFPHTWSDGQGYATYTLRIILPDDAPPLAISIPQLYSAYTLSINDSLIASNGRVGLNAHETKPQWRPQTIALPWLGDTLNLALTIANFHHSVGGIREPIAFGAASLLRAERDQTHLFEIILFSVLVFIGLVFVFMFFIWERKKVLIYFSLLCFTWAIRSMFSNQYVAIQHYPDFDWLLMIRIEYITLYLTMIWAVLFLGKLFSGDANIIVKYVLVGGNLIFVGLTLFTLPILFTKLLNVFLVFAALLLIYGIGVVLTALINGRPGSLVLTFSIVLGVNIFAYDILAYEGIFPFSQLVFSVGYILIFILNALALLYSLNVLKSNRNKGERLRYEDFFGKI